MKAVLLWVLVPAWAAAWMAPFVAGLLPLWNSENNQDLAWAWLRLCPSLIRRWLGAPSDSEFEWQVAVFFLQHLSLFSLVAGAAFLVRKYSSGRGLPSRLHHESGGLPQTDEARGRPVRRDQGR